MALTPDSISDELIDEAIEQEDLPQTSRTWRLDFENGRIGGIIDEEEAIKQFAAKAIRTARSRYRIYSDDYGCELDTLIGADVTIAYLDAEIPRMVREALVYDDRIEDVSEISYRRENDKLYIEIALVTIFGDIGTEVVT